MTFRGALLLVVAAALGAGGIWIWQRPKESPQRVDLSGLSAQLNRAAEKAFPVPSLTVPSVSVKVPASEIEARVQTTIRLAETVDGKARQALDRDLAKVVLATVPAERVELFLLAAQVGQIGELTEKAPGGELVDCEVVFLAE